MKKNWLIFSLMLFTVSPAFAEKLYITENFQVSVRAGQGEEFTKVGSLNSGQPVEVAQKEKDWALIKLSPQVSGWIPIRYLVNTPSIRFSYDTCQKDLEALKNSHEEHQAEVSGYQEENRRLEKEIQEKIAEIKKMQQELDRRVISSQMGWFLGGAGVFFGGLVFGLLIMRTIASRRPSRELRLDL